MIAEKCCQSIVRGNQNLFIVVYRNNDRNSFTLLHSRHSRPRRPVAGARRNDSATASVGSAVVMTPAMFTPTLSVFARKVAPLNLSNAPPILHGDH